MSAEPGDRSPVFVVEDDDGLRDATEALLQMCGHEVRSYVSAAAFLTAIEQAQTGCIVLDVRMPGIDGLAFQRHMIETGSPLPIIFMSGYADVALSVKAMRQGAFMFLTKPFRDQDLLDAVAEALRFEREGRARRLERLVARAAFATLSARERDIMAGMTHGEPNKLIAARLGLSEAMIKVVRAGIMRKMTAASLPHLTRLAERHELC